MADTLDLKSVRGSMRHLLILEEVARVGVPVTPTEINKSLGLAAANAAPAVYSLEDEGFLQREHDGRAYSPAPAQDDGDRRHLFYPRSCCRLAVMNALSKDIGETCNLVLPDRHAMKYLDRVRRTGHCGCSFPSELKCRFTVRPAANCISAPCLQTGLQRLLNSGRLESRTPNTITDPDELLVELQMIRARGYSEDNEEFIEGMIALAVPVLDTSARMVCSLAFHAPTPGCPLTKRGSTWETS